MRSFAWVPAGWALAKAALTPKRIPGLEANLQGLGWLRRYSGGGQAAWIALPEEPEKLDEALLAEGLSGVRLFGTPGRPRLGIWNGGAFAQRVKLALDPDNRFLEI
jgi:hypothetical protein